MNVAWSYTEAHMRSATTRWLAADKTMSDFHRFTRDLLWRRRRQPALTGESVATVLMDNFNRVLAFHRWIEGVGRDVLVVASLNESTLGGYRIPVPSGGGLGRGVQQ